MSPQLPTTAMTYMKQNGREIQMCAASSPGTPFKIKNPGVRLEILAPDMMSDVWGAFYIFCQQLLSVQKGEVGLETKYENGLYNDTNESHECSSC